MLPSSLDEDRVNPYELTIAVLTHNRVKYLLEAIDAIRKQLHLDFHRAAMP